MRLFAHPRVHLSNNLLLSSVEGFSTIDSLDVLAEAFLNRGNTYIFLGNFTDALAEYERALELGTKDPHAAYFNKGLAYEAMRNLTKAYESFQKASELQPEWAMPIERLKRYEDADYKSLQ